MKNLFKIFMLLFLILLLFITFVNASSINMNLSSDEINENSTQNNTNEVNTNQNEVINTDTTNLSDVENPEPANNQAVTSDTISQSEEFLTIENVLSIIIIVIGILLILLAGAILIRFK